PLAGVSMRHGLLAWCVMSVRECVMDGSGERESVKDRKTDMEREGNAGSLQRRDMWIPPSLIHRDPLLSSSLSVSLPLLSLSVALPLLLSLSLSVSFFSLCRSPSSSLSVSLTLLLSLSLSLFFDLCGVVSLTRSPFSSFRSLLLFLCDTHTHTHTPHTHTHTHTHRPVHTHTHTHGGLIYSLSRSDLMLIRSGWEVIYCCVCI